MNGRNWARALLGLLLTVLLGAGLVGCEDKSKSAESAQEFFSKGAKDPAESSDGGSGRTASTGNPGQSGGQ